MTGSMMIEATPENLEPTKVPMEIVLPKFLWLVLTARAKAQGVDLETVFQQVFEAGIQKGLTIFGMTVPISPPA